MTNPELRGAPQDFSAGGDEPIVLEVEVMENIENVVPRALQKAQESKKPVTFTFNGRQFTVEPNMSWEDAMGQISPQTVRSRDKRREFSEDGFDFQGEIDTIRSLSEDDRKMVEICKGIKEGKTDFSPTEILAAAVQNYVINERYPEQMLVVVEILKNLTADPKKAQEKLDEIRTKVYEVLTRNLSGK